METEIIYKLSAKDFDMVVQSRILKLQKDVILARWRDNYVGVDTVAEIHNVHRDTVVKYANAKLIPHFKKGKLYRFSLADVLEFDFKELRKIN